MNNLVGDVKANPRDFYRYINSQKKDTKGSRTLKKDKEVVLPNQISRKQVSLTTSSRMYLPRVNIARFLF